MPFNPCCRMPLQKGVRILAFVDAVQQTIGCIFVIVVAFILIANPEAARKRSPKLITDQEVAIIIIACIITACVEAVGIFLAIRLFKGAGRRNIAPCRSWMYYKIVYLVIVLIGMIINAVNPSTKNSIPYSEYVTSTSEIISVLFIVYMIVCVWLFIKELKHEQLNGRTTLIMGPPTGTPISYLMDDASISTFVSGLPE